MVSGSLKLFFNLLTLFNWQLESIALGSVTSFFGIKGAFFAENDKMDLRQIFFKL